MKTLDDLIVDSAVQHGLDPDLVRAIVKTESGGDPWAVRYESGWRYFVNVRDWADHLSISYDTEQVLQACSYNVMQVMGSVCRELGFKDNLLKLAGDPALGLQYGCIKLKSLFIRFGEEEKVIAAYNAGSPRKTPGGHWVNEQYVDKVYKFLRALRALKA